MGMHVFTYGSLMFDPVWLKVARGSYEKIEARVYGYTRRKLKGEIYPAALCGTDADCVDGIAHLNVNQDDIRRLDEFEGPYYRREMAECRLPDGSAIMACLYILDEQYMNLVEDEPWDPAWFSKIGVQLFLED
ncbi:MAG: gamma-glutamylcyclotransferase family protein [Dehalococcoidia bacterium]